MARIDYKADCICGSEILTTFKKPTRMQHSVSKVTCEGCLSEYMFMCTIEYKEGGGRIYVPIHETINLTPKLLDAVKKHNEQMKIKAEA